MKKTLLQVVIKRGFEEKKAQKLIQGGQVFVNHTCIFIPSAKVDETSIIEIKESKRWVSRGALKLLWAIKEFKINFSNKVVLDIGSSTGGFSQVILEKGAKHVFALDVGHNQLAFSLRQNPKLTSFEKTNLKTINSNMFQWRIDIAVADVSFISLRSVFKALANLDSVKQIVVLIKPQFEARREQVSTGGFVKKTFHQEILNKIKVHAKEYNFTIKQITTSPIKGEKSKNIEYLALFEREIWK